LLTIYIWKSSKYQPSKKKFTGIGEIKDEAVHAPCSPEQRSLARKMGSCYLPKTPPTVKGNRNVSKIIFDGSVKISLTFIPYKLLRNVPNLNILFFERNKMKRQKSEIQIMKQFIIIVLLNNVH
jgi:hypothetical protein